MEREQQTFKNDAICIQAHDIGKCYRIYNDPKDRLKQAFWRNKRRYFKEFWALRNIDLEIKKGETLAILGRNGSGKSTLLKMICGTLTPTEGSIYTKGTVAALLELGSGFNPEFTGVENVFLNASLFGLSKKQVEERLDDIKAFADIGDFVNQPVQTYSSGMLVRLAFAVIAHVEASVLIIDEALSVGDAVFGQRCMRFIRKFKEEGTLLFVSHDLNAVSSLCERAMWIDSGKLKMVGETKKIITAYTRYCQDSSDKEANQKCVPKEMNKCNAFEEVITGKQADKIKVNSNIDIKSKGPTLIESGKNRQSLNTLHTEKGRTISNKIDWDKEVDYGSGNAKISFVKLINADGEATTMPECGEKVRLIINSHSKLCIRNFMAGFIVRNRTGLLIWGENNIGGETIEVRAGDDVEVGFEFSMPFIAPGDYSISIAISEGDPYEPTVLHYKPDFIVINPLLATRKIHGVFAVGDMAIYAKVQS